MEYRYYRDDELKQMAMDILDQIDDLRDQTKQDKKKALLDAIHEDYRWSVATYLQNYMKQRQRKRLRQSTGSWSVNNGMFRKKITS